MAEFYQAQAAVVEDLTNRTGVDIAEAVATVSKPPPIPESLRTDEDYRRQNGQPPSRAVGPGQLG